MTRSACGSTVPAILNCTVLRRHTHDYLLRVDEQHIHGSPREELSQLPTASIVPCWPTTVSPYFGRDRHTGPLGGLEHGPSSSCWPAGEPNAEDGQGRAGVPARWLVGCGSRPRPAAANRGAGSRDSRRPRKLWAWLRAKFHVTKGDRATYAIVWSNVSEITAIKNYTTKKKLE
jgi:hypothetical protein